jgi:hypothetical protein
MSSQDLSALKEAQELLDHAIKNLQEVIGGITEVRDALQTIQEVQETPQPGYVKKLADTLDLLGSPLQGGSLSMYQALTALLQVNPSNDDYFLWMTFVDLPVMRERIKAEEQAATLGVVLMEWLAPHLEHVSPRTRSAITRAIASPAGFPKTVLLTPKAFGEQLRKPQGGMVGKIRGLGIKGLDELRQVLGIEVAG